MTCVVAYHVWGLAKLVHRHHWMKVAYVRY
jgi:hypothetical protein